MAETVKVTYNGSGGTSADVAPYNKGNAAVKEGTVVEVPEKLANALILSSDWTREDGKTAGDVYESTDTERKQEEWAANREPNHVGESPREGFVREEELAGKSYSEVVAEREAEQEKAVEKHADPGEETSANGEPVREHPVVTRQRQAAKGEQEGGSGQDSSDEKEGDN